MQSLWRPGSGHVFRWSSLLKLSASLVAISGFSIPAAAFPFDFGPQGGFGFSPWAARPPAPRAVKPGAVTTAPRDKDAGREKEGDLASKAKGVLTIVVSLDRQQATLYSDGEPIAHSRVSTGVPGHPTPTGVFSIIQKDRWHHSNIYDSAPMFFMQRITWSGVAMHQGVVPNSPASHGCIRLPEAFAKQLWGITKLGVRVLVARGDPTPVAFSHPRLFTLKREPLEAKPEPAAPEMSSADPTSAERVKAAHGALEVAQLANSKADAGSAAGSGKPANPALDAMAYAAGTPREPAGTSSERAKFEFEAPKIRWMKSSVAPTGVAEVHALKPGPISVFVSRKEGKLFVRKGFDPVFNVAVTIEQPAKPLGTDVYTALAVNDDNTTMRWIEVSMPGGWYAGKRSEKTGRLEYVGPPSNAREALDRVTIPPEALDRIAELLTPGASLIISDQGLGPETGDGTDFIVLTRESKGDNAGEGGRKPRYY